MNEFFYAFYIKQSVTKTHYGSCEVSLSQKILILTLKKRAAPNDRAAHFVCGHIVSYFFSRRFNWNKAGRKMQSEHPSAMNIVRLSPKRSVSVMSGFG